MARELLIRSPDGKPQTVRLDGDRLSIGRSTSNDLCYPDDPGLSRHHLLLEREGDSWVVRDLGSKNGTLVNGERIRGPRRLMNGDRITVGRLVAVFGDATGSIGESVVFVEPRTADVPASTTFVASLNNLLSGDQREALESDVSASSFGVDLRVKALIHAGRELAGHLPLPDLFPLILDLALDAVNAERGVLLTVENDQLVARAARGENFRISNTVRDRVLRQRDSILVRDVLREEAFRERMSIREHRVRSMMAVPLQTNDNVIGLIYVDSPNVIRQFSPEDLNLLTVMANVAAVRIEHARLAEVEQAERLMAKELEQAAEIQRRLLPDQPPEIPGLDLAGYNAPCRTVGGDYYDFFPYPDGTVAFVVADVAGKGLPAAMLVSSIQARVQVMAEEPTDLPKMLIRLNRLLISSSPGNRFVSLFFCRLDPATGRTEYVSAGHNPPFLVRAGGEVEQLTEGGPILGILPCAEYFLHTCRLDHGDVLVLYSDGVTEATGTGGEEFGEDRLAATLVQHRGKPASEVVEVVRSALADWTGGGQAEDDVTLVVAHRC